MALSLMYITNNVDVALIAEKAGVNRIWIDLETLGKEERQKNMNTVKSHHTVEDVKKMSKVLTKAELMVRINPWHENSLLEIEQVLEAGAKRIMLPMWKTPFEVDKFLRAVNSRAKTTLLLETKQAVECLDQVLENELLDEIHIGLNDLHISYGKTFMFEMLSSGIVESLCTKIKKKGKRYGFGGIARVGEGTLPAERIIMEHYRLGSTRAILSRSFCNVDEIVDLVQIERIFTENIRSMRDYELSLAKVDAQAFEQNKREVKICVDQIVEKIKGNK
jgi:hypothetical protein